MEEEFQLGCLCLKNSKITHHIITPTLFLSQCSSATTPMTQKKQKYKINTHKMWNDIHKAEKQVSLHSKTHLFITKYNLLLPEMIQSLTPLLGRLESSLSHSIFIFGEPPTSIVKPPYPQIKPPVLFRRQVQLEV